MVSKIFLDVSKNWIPVQRYHDGVSLIFAIEKDISSAQQHKVDEPASNTQQITSSTRYVQ